MLKNEIYLTDLDYESFKPVIMGLNLHLTADRKIIVYIDSTWVKDYLVMVETIDSPYWNWKSPDMRRDTGYFEVESTIGELIKLIRH